MGTTTLQISFGEGLMARLGRWRAKRLYPPTKSNDAFVKDMLVEALEKEVPK